MKDFIPATLIGLAVALAGLLAVPVAEAQIADGQGSWTMKAPMPGGPRAEFPGGTVNGKIYVFGGGARGIGYDIARTEEYDPVTDRWRTRAPMPRGLNHVGAVVMDSKIYAAGGFGGSAHKDPDNAFLSYDPASDSWQALTPLPSKRGAVAVAAIDGKIHVIGGREGDEPLITTHNVYDPATGTWSVAAPLSRARDHMVAMTVDCRIHVIGGRYSVGDEDMTGLHEVYDPRTNSWTQAAAMPTPRGGVVGALYRRLIFVMGAEDGMRTYDENEAYDAKTDRWFKLKPLPMRLHAFAAAAAGNDLYIMGGAKVSGSLEVIDQTYAFSLP